MLLSVREGSGISRIFCVKVDRRARRRHGQWYVLAGFALHDAPHAVFPSIVDVRGDSIGAVLGQGDMPVAVPSGAFGQTAQKTGFSAVALPRRSSTSLGCLRWSCLLGRL